MPQEPSAGGGLPIAVCCVVFFLANTRRVVSLSVILRYPADNSSFACDDVYVGFLLLVVVKKSDFTIA